MESWFRLDPDDAPPASHYAATLRPQGSSTPTDAASQRVFGVPGASLHDAAALDAGARDAGVEGEAVVGAELERLAARYRNTYVFHSVKLPGAIGDIDHLVVQGIRMLLVDTKNWKSGADYVVYSSDRDGDNISRDGQPFEGGTIHLPRQLRQWSKEFSDAGMDVRGALVIANRDASAAAGVGIKYSFADLDGLPEIFGVHFGRTGAPALHPALLDRLKSLVQPPPSPTVTPSLADARAAFLRPQLGPVSRPKMTRGTIVAVICSILSWTVLPLPFAGFSAAPLIFFAHRLRRRALRERLGGSGLLLAVLIATYAQLAIWLILVVAMIATGAYRSH